MDSMRRVREAFMDLGAEISGIQGYIEKEDLFEITSSSTPSDTGNYHFFKVSMLVSHA